MSDEPSPTPQDAPAPAPFDSIAALMEGKSAEELTAIRDSMFAGLSPDQVQATAKSRICSALTERIGELTPPNPVAALHKTELVAAVEAATPDELKQLDADCAAQGWSPAGQIRSRIARRLFELANAPATIQED